MSREFEPLSVKPFIALITDALRQLESDMVRQAHESGFPELRMAHNAVFGTLPSGGARTSEMAARAGITKQSMGEVVRELIDLGILVASPDPQDRRAKIVSYTDYGRVVARSGRRHLAELETRFAEAFGAADYESARRVLAEVPEMMARHAAGEARPAP